MYWSSHYNRSSCFSVNEGQGAIAAISLFVPGPEDVAFAGLAATKFGGRIIGGISKFADNVVDGISRLFKGERSGFDGLQGVQRLSDDELAKIIGRGPLNRQTRKELESSKNSFEALIEEHLQKIDDFKADPDAFDNKGLLKDVTPELREKIIQGRIKSLEKQIQGQRENLRKVNEALEKLEE